MQEIVIPCRDPDAAARMLGELGFEVEYVLPADAPQIVVVVGHGARLRLLRDGIEPSGLQGIPQPRRVSLAIHRHNTWHLGRAGMSYRDLVPDRLGGWLIASHIRIADGGPVPDYVHHHAIRVQLIYCRAGWVRLVYEDQGEPFVMEAGDCVTQPPGIRHRVLACSAGLEVIELASPAVHPTFADRALALPNGARPRDFAGQRFVWHRAAAATWAEAGGWRVRDLGLDAATAGLARGRVLRGPGHRATATAGVTFGFVLAGAATVGDHALGLGDAFVLPPDEPCTVAGGDDAELLEVTLA